MLIQYLDNGEITHVYTDPISEEMYEFLIDMPNTIDVPPVVLGRDTQTIDVLVLDENGEVVLDENGQPVLEEIEEEYGRELIETFAVQSTTHWVDPETDTLQERPTFDFMDEIEIVADGVDEVTFDALPAGATVTVDGELVDTSDGELTIAADMPAEYEIRFECWPYQPQIVKVTAHAPVAQ